MAAGRFFAAVRTGCGRLRRGTISAAVFHAFSGEGEDSAQKRLDFTGVEINLIGKHGGEIRRLPSCLASLWEALNWLGKGAQRRNAAESTFR